MVKKKENENLFCLPIYFLLCSFILPHIPNLFFFSVWRTSYCKFCRVGLLATNYFNFPSSEDILISSSILWMFSLSTRFWVERSCLSELEKHCAIFFWPLCFPMKKLRSFKFFSLRVYIFFLHDFKVSSFAFSF